MMSYESACKILNICQNSGYTDVDIKRQYRLNALQYHPDKNPNEDTSIQFHKIQDAYEYLMKYEGYMDDDDDKSDTADEPTIVRRPSTFRTILLSFINDITRDDDSNNMAIFYAILKKVSSLCENKAILYMETLDKPLLIKIHDILLKYQDAFHYTKSFINKIQEVIQNKDENDECIILNPTLDDMYNNTLYKLVFNNNTYAIPLWHHELIYDNSGNELYVKCLPILSDNIDIDSNNDIYITMHYEMREIWQVEILNIICGPTLLPINVKTLHIVKSQRITFVNMGIPRINAVDIYDTKTKSNVYVDLILS